MKEAVATWTLREILGGHEVLLLKRATEPFLGAWFPVEGAIDPGESPDEAMVRELREETGLAPIAAYRESTRVVPSVSRHVRIHIYASFVSRDLPVVLNEEHTAFQWRSPEDALRLLRLPAQQDALKRVCARFVAPRASERSR